MTNNSIEGALAATENTFEIDLLNKVTGTTYPQAAVYRTNTLGQVLKEYALDIGVNPDDSKILFENKRTGASTSDTNETVGGLGLQEGDVLSISDNAGVAGEDDVFEIDLLNKVTGTTYPQAAVYGTNTLGQVLKEYALDIGVNPDDSKILFENKRTGASTSDTNKTVGGLRLQEGDVLAISDNAGVAGEEDIFKIDLLNKVTGTTYAQAAVYGTNTLGQVLKEYALDIGVNPDDSKILFENKRTGASTSDTDETVGGLELQEGDVLAISDNAGVAGEDGVLEIDLINKVTGTTYPQAAVYGANTLGQVLKEYALDIGLDPEHRKNFFENERTGQSTNNMNTSVEELGLRNGDVVTVYPLCDCCP